MVVTDATDEDSTVPGETQGSDSENITASDSESDQVSAGTETNEKDGFFGWLSNAFKSIASKFGFQFILSRSAYTYMKESTKS